jgi:hypothetical protein
MQIPNLSIDALEQSSSVVFLLNDGLEITYCNPAWDEFARANGGGKWTRDKVAGYDLTQCIPPVLRSFYDRVFASARNGEVMEFEYHCSSPEKFRLLHMRVLPFLQAGGFAVVNSVRIETKYGEPSPANATPYFEKHGLATMCAHCRRVRLQESWHWVPGLLNTHEPSISHGLCPICHAYFYGDLKCAPPDPSIMK